MGWVPLSSLIQDNPSINTYFLIYIKSCVLYGTACTCFMAVEVCRKYYILSDLIIMLSRFSEILGEKSYTLNRMIVGNRMKQEWMYTFFFLFINTKKNTSIKSVSCDSRTL